MIWVKNTRGKKDAMLTFAFAAFAVVIFKFLTSGFSLNINGHDIRFGSIDAASIAALLAPTLGAYVARRHSETKYNGHSDDNDDDYEPDTNHSRKDV